MTMLAAYRGRFSCDGYLQELKANRPSLIVLHSPFAHVEYRRAVADFLASETHRYEAVWIDPVRVFVRRDRSAAGATAGARG